MKTSVYKYERNEWLHPQNAILQSEKDARLVLCFAAKSILTKPGIYEMLQQKFPQADIAMCSTAGEIFNDTVLDETLVAAAIEFDKTAVQTASVNMADFLNSYNAAAALVNKLPKKDLSYILVLSGGSLVNGSELAKGLADTAGPDILVTGGLAGDGSNFQSTMVGLNQQPSEGMIAAIGFYGKNIIVSHGSQGGWETFGPEREVTKSVGNKLFEMDNKNALELYKKYLGAEAENLPASALLFPLSITIPGSTQAVVRTILSIDEAGQSMTFAGDIPQGSKVRLMKANFDKLTAAASSAAQESIQNENHSPVFALLISCIGRKIILGTRIDEEVEAVNELFGGKTLLAGFYSYGEISPFNEGGACQLHNQTMTITSFYEL